ncbi:MAG: thioesterase family protein [Rhodospirillales bacterium]|nr:thioesterase family protein [Rhodospirillales bacterium]MBO6788400.1 thioesterase family protein [Rhodospirillales bacterium]
MTDATPARLWEETVSPDWVDYNGHMNVAYYVLIFDHATDAFLEEIGMNEALRAETGSSVFVAEAHITYDNEVMEGERVYVTSQVLDCDEKRLHLFHAMYNAEDDSLCATNELMILQVNLNTRKVGPFIDHVQSRIRDIYKAHEPLAAPDQKGRVIGIRRKT